MLAGYPMEAALRMPIRRVQIPRVPRWEVDRNVQPCPIGIKRMHAKWCRIP